VNAITKQAKIGVKAAMKQAGEYIKGKTINGGLMNVGLYMRQARECLRLAGKWFNKGDHEEAANWKDREMINHAMAMEAIKAVKEIKQIVRFLKPFEKRGISLNGMPIEFASQIDALLGKYGRKNAGSVPAISLRNFITNFNAEDEYGGITIPDSILDGVPKDFKDMPLSELHDLKDAIQSISDVGKNLNKALRTDKKELISDQGKEILSTTEKKVGLNNLPYSGIGSKSLTDAQKAINKLSKATESLVDWGKQLRTIQALCNFMGEPATRYIYDPIHAAYADGISRIHAGWNEVTKGIDQFFSNTSFQDELKKVYKFDFLPGGELTGEELHGVLLNMGNEGNLDRLTNGYFKDDPAAEQKLLQMVSQLPKKFFDLAQHVWDHCESYFPEVRKLEMDVRGIDPKKVEARPFTAITSEGGKVNMRGGYFHISYDYEKGEQVPRTSTQLNELYKQVSVAHTMTEHGHTEARTSGGDKKLNLRVWQEVIPHFISNVNYDLAMRRSIIDVNRLLKTKDVETAVTGALSRDSYIRMRQWLTAVAQDQRGTDYNAFLRGLRQRVMLSQLGINLKAFPEFIPTNFLMVAGKKGILPTIQGISDYYFGGKREELVDKIHSKSVMMKNRVRFGLVDRDINEFSNTILGNKVNSVRAFMLAMHSLADETISMPAWNKEYDDAIAEGVPEQEAINRADGLITENFGSGILPDQAEVMRGSQGKKLMTMYYSWYNMLFNKYWSTLKQSGTQFQQGENIAAAQTLIHGAFYYWVLPGLISGIVNTTLNNTLGKNQTMQQNIKEIEKDVALYPVRTVPIIGSAIDYLVSQSLGQRTEYSLSPVESLPKLALEFGTALWKHQAGKNESTAEKGARLASMTVGYPQRVNTWVFNAYDWMNRNGDHTLAQALKDMFTRESKHR